MFDLHREYFTAINRQSPPLSLTKPRGRAARRVTARGVGTDQPEEAVANKARGCVGGGREAGHLRLRVSRAAREGSAAASAAPPSGPMWFRLRRNGGGGGGSARSAADGAEVIIAAVTALVCVGGFDQCEGCVLCADRRRMACWGRYTGEA